jgi:hypothetical protein
MSRPTITIHNVTTGAIEMREMDNAEFKQYELDQEQLQLKAKAKTQTAQAKQAIFDRLGITADEATLLLS